VTRKVGRVCRVFERTTSVIEFVSIFIASRLSSFCPLATAAPACTATLTTMPGMLAPM
jgi:hypothetical protein